MASLEEFQQLIESDPERAMDEYVVHVSQDLDGTPNEQQVLVNKPFGEQDVVFEFVLPNIILLRAKAASEEAHNRLWYLPWVSRDVAKADLGQEGAQYFSTSQLNGCRFTVQYTDGSRKHATVLHVAGNFDFKDGSTRREELETSAIGPVTNPALRRRYSIGQSMLKGQKKKRIVGDETRTYYGGNKAWIFGYRDDSGAWQFLAQEMDEQYGRADSSKGTKALT